jgi:hypothetical protein
LASHSVTEIVTISEDSDVDFNSPGMNL